VSAFLLQNAQRLHQAGNLAEAARLYAEVLRLNPNQFEPLYALGVLHYQTSRYADAEQLFAAALRLDPSAVDAHYRRGCTLQRLNRNEDAVIAFDRALANRPGFVDALMARGVARMALNRYEDALGDFDAILAADPEEAGAWTNRGCTLQGMNRNEEALTCFEKALALKPDLVEALISGGSVLAALKRFDEAAERYEKVLSINPDLPYVFGNLVLFRLQACDWRYIDSDRARIAADVKAGKPVIQPFINVTLSASLADQLQCARTSIAYQWPKQSRALWRGERYGHDKIRVVYISADFRDHAVARLVAGLLEHHDKTRLETTAISLVPDDGSAMRKRLHGTFDRFIDAERQSDEQVATLLREAEVDIAVDLMGFTSGCRPGILAFRPAPVQVNFLGYPGTMAASYVDYIVADRFVIPDEHRAFYPEKIVTLPDAYQCNDRRRAIADATPSRAELGLPERAFVFCCFNNSNKITPEIFSLWMRLLHQVDGGVLWLLEDNAAATGNLRREAATRGIAAERLVFAPRVKPAEHLARHRAADLFIDTLPYGAHTTASDALWTGLPVLTCQGTTFAGRVGASLLRAAGLPDLITDSLDAYEALALILARNRDALRRLKETLVRNRDTCALFDTARFTRHFEAALTTMRQRQRDGNLPAPFAVEAMPA
jgi:predicted O-linked N-acetylglucosamine transferase (SPINDLY family)